MFKITINRDPIPHSECESKGHLTIRIKTGYTCGDITNCEFGNICKHKSSYRFHNFSVSLHRFFEYKLHTKLPHLIYISRKWERLSGTRLCPYNHERIYTCWDCSHQIGLEECEIDYKDRKPYEKSGRCGSFEKCEWADDYKDDIDEDKGYK